MLRQQMLVSVWGMTFPAAWWQEVVGVPGLGVTAVLSDSWSCRVLQDRLCYWRQETLFPPAAWVTWQDWQPGEVLWQQLKAVLVNWHLRVKLNSLSSFEAMNFYFFFFETQLSRLVGVTLSSHHFCKLVLLCVLCKCVECRHPGGGDRGAAGTVPMRRGWTHVAA